MKNLISSILFLALFATAGYATGSSGCSTFNIIGLAHGTHVDSLFMSSGVTIIANPNPGGRPDAVIYNTNGNWTEDPDLNVGIGNVIIIKENPNKPDGDGTGPDDNATGGTLSFLFKKPVKVVSFIAVDVEETGAYAKAYNSRGGLIKTVNIPAKEDASVQTVAVNATGVARFDIVTPGSSGFRLNLSCFYFYGGWKTDEEENQSLKEDAAFIMNAYPNPFHSEVTLEFALPQTTKARAEIYAADGRKVATLFDDVASEGKVYNLKFDATGMADGVYFYRLTTEDGLIRNTRMMLVK